MILLCYDLRIMQKTAAIVILLVSAAAARAAQLAPFSDAVFLEALRAARSAAFLAPDTKADVSARLAGSGVPQSFIDRVFSDPRLALDPRVLPQVGHPRERLTYDQYRKIFMTPERIRAGRAFLAAQAPLLSSVEARYHVDRSLLAALVGVETFYGRSTGRYGVVNALYTVAQKVPTRSAFAARELAEFLELCWRDGLDPFSVNGSYAGAFGFGQFIPSTFNRYAVDFDGDGKRSFDRWPDVLATMSNYLARMGCEPGGGYADGSRNWNAVFAYNHSDNYVRVVLELRAAIEN